jgi:glutaredoxin
MKFTSSPGRKRSHKVTLYALSTCGWCRRTKELLDAEDIGYDYVFVDLCQGAERDEASAKVRALNPRGSYPTIEIDGEVVAGFDEERIRELLGI